MSDLIVNSRLTLPATELTFTAARSSGPGGQNVNKVNSKVILHWSMADVEGFSAGWRRRLKARFGNRINRDGAFVLHSEKYRDQSRNLTDVKKRLCDMLKECEFPPKPRKATKPSYGSKLRRLNRKRENSQKKQNRRDPGMND